MAVLVLALSCFYSSNSLAQDLAQPTTSPLIELEISDDGWVEVPLQFAFPFYGNSFTTSFMFSNGVIGFFDPSQIAGGLCCNGEDLADPTNPSNYYLNPNYYPTSPFNYTIMALHTDLLDYGPGRFYTQGDTTYQRYFWEKVSEYGRPDSENTFDLTIFPSGNIDYHYKKIDIQNHNITVGQVGDYSAGEYEQYFYHNRWINGGYYWENLGNQPKWIPPGDTICTADPTAATGCAGYAAAWAQQQYDASCSADPLYDSGCTGYATAYYTQQCSANPLYDSGCTGYYEAQCDANPLYDFQCTGYAAAYFTQQCQQNPQYDMQCNGYQAPVTATPTLTNTVSTGNAIVDSIISAPPVTATVTPPPVTQLQPVASVVLQEQPVTENNNTINNIEASVEAEILAIDAPAEEAVIEEEVATEEAVVEEKAPEDKPATKDKVVEKEVVAVEPVTKEAPKKLTAAQKKKAKENKMREIIQDKLSKLAVAMGEAQTLKEQQQLQALINALINYVPGFDAYGNIAIPGRDFYNADDIYKNKKIPENQRGLLNGLASQILHEKMVSQQYKGMN